MMRTPRTQSGTEYTAFTLGWQYALCVNSLLGSIARRQFVPTTAPSSSRPTIGEIRP
ncbi:hypothetical protein [Hoylesella timonensis]|uniref:hypothetical protein n=1 Tax=Hoylesella timonensis TaxID=386414 RepID=UPI0012E00B05|nr:hypothetical protein [Hoylesella timonensis]